MEHRTATKATSARKRRSAGLLLTMAHCHGCRPGRFSIRLQSSSAHWGR